MSDKKPDADTPQIETPDTELVQDAEQPSDQPDLVEDAVLVEPTDPSDPLADTPQDDAAVDDTAIDESPHSPEPETRSDPVAAPTPLPEEQPANSMMPMIFGGVIAAALGAGAMYLLQPQPVVPVAAPVDTARLEALEAALIDLRNAPPPEIIVPEVDLSSLDSMGDRLQLLESSIADLNDKLVEVAAAGGSGDGGSTSAAVVAQLSEMRAALDAQKAENAAVQTELATIAEQADAKIAEAEARAGEAQTAAAERAALAADRAALSARQATLAKLIAASETGAPFEDLLADLSATGAQMPGGLDAVSKSGVPTLVALQNAYGEAARAGLAESVRATMGTSAGERFTAFLRAQVGARSLEAREGNDPDAILSRAEAALRAGQIDVVLSELGTLPPEGQAAMASWIDLAAARQTALSAISALSSALTEN